MSYTADDLLVEVRDVGSLGSTAVVGQTDAALLRHADAEIRDTLVPLILGVHEELYQRVFDTTVVSGTAAYRLNKRVSMSRINTVQWVNADSSVFNLQRMEPKRAVEISVLSSVQGRPWAYYLEGSRVVLYPTPNLSGTLRIRAQVRPSRLTLTTDTPNVLAITAVSGIVTQAPEWEMTTAAHGISVSGIRDVVAGTPSFEHLALDSTATVQDSTAVSIVKTDFSTAPAIGDYLCVSDYTPVVQLPVEMHPALVELVVARTLRAQQKVAEAASHAEEAQRLVALGIQALTPRVDTADRKIVGGPHYRKRVPLRGNW